MELRPHRAEDDVLEDPVPAKADINLVESTETGIPSKYADIVASRLSRAHRDFLMEHHGTLDLDPIPSMDLADPYNWPAWKVCNLNSNLTMMTCGYTHIDFYTARK